MERNREGDHALVHDGRPRRLEGQHFDELGHLDVELGVVDDLAEELGLVDAAEVGAEVVPLWKQEAESPTYI